MASVLQTMNLLNEAAGRFPEAVSFLAGRPPDIFADPTPVQSWIEIYLAERGSTTAEHLRLGQYSETNGLTRDIVAAFLRSDGLCQVAPSDCMMVNGAQEGLLIALLGLCRNGRRALTVDPTYVGFAGAAEIVGIAVDVVPDDDQFVDRLIARLAGGGGDVGCIYLVPDHANPTGRTLTRDERLAILDASSRYGATIIEDIAYRRYRYEGERIPTFFELADGRGVVLIESFAKSLIPGLRVGVLVGQSQQANGPTLADQWSSIKSYISVATSPLNQAALAGFLLEQDFSLAAWMAPRLARLSGSLDELQRAVNACFEDGDATHSRRPEGGFFCTLSLPRNFTLDDCVRCAREAHVLVMPMTLFSLEQRCADQIRLAFSNVDPALIQPSIERLHGWLNSSV